MIAVEWPGPLPDLTGNPALRVTVTTPRDQAVLHRDLARLGYVIDLVDSSSERDVWDFVHPDGTNR